MSFVLRHQATCYLTAVVEHNPCALFLPRQTENFDKMKNAASCSAIGGCCLSTSAPEYLASARDRDSSGQRKKHTRYRMHSPLGGCSYNTSKYGAFWWCSRIVSIALRRQGVRRRVENGGNGRVAQLRPRTTTRRPIDRDKSTDERLKRRRFGGGRRQRKVDRGHAACDGHQRQHGGSHRGWHGRGSWREWERGRR